MAVVSLRGGVSSRGAYLHVVELRDVVDLEAQLAADEGEREETLRARDRGVYLAMAPAPSDPARLLAAWLAALRARKSERSLGEHVESAQRVLGYVLALLGLSMGWGTAQALLHFEEAGPPVNVGYYLLVIVVGQLAVLLVLMFSVALRSAFGALPVVGDVGRLLVFVRTRFQSWLSDSSLDARLASLKRVRTRLGLYRQMERYAVLSQSQLFALAFNVGVLLSCARLILLSDLAFSWSTSVASLDAGQVHRLCRALATPFSWWFPEAVPSSALVERTQYFRLEGRFAGAAAGTRGDPALAGQWWRFLTACTIVYGLLPRLITYGAFRYRYRRAERSVPLDTPAVQRVLARMATPELSTRASAPEPQRAEPPRHVQARPLEIGRAAVVLYRDISTDPALLVAALERELGLEIDSVHRAGGFAAGPERSLSAELARLGLSVCVVAEAWEAPDKSLRNLLAELRRGLGPSKSLRVVLIGEASAQSFAAPKETDVRLYRDRLTLLEDPYLSVETLAGTGEPLQP